MGLSLLDTKLVAIGCALWDFPPEADPDRAARGLGGIVVAIESDRDDETGEIRRRFITAKQVGRDSRNQLGIRFDVIAETEVEMVALMNSASVRALMRRMGQVIAESKGIFVTDHHRCIAALGALEAALG